MRGILFTALILFSLIAKPQQVIDKVIAVVGKAPVLLSDLETQHLQKQKEDPEADKCETMEDLVYQKLLLAQADRDSVTVADAEVDAEINKRLAYYIQMFGSEEKFEEFYGKRTNVFKDEIRSEVHDQLLAQRMQQKVTGDVKLTPSEVRSYFNSIPTDSLPLINTELQIGQIVKMPPVSADAKRLAREKLESYRQRVLNGESMHVLAALYTEDQASAKTGGFYSFGRGMMVPEFEAVAFKLKNGEVSEVFETAYGYHFIQLVARKGEMVDVRHILISPKITEADRLKARDQLDSIHDLIVNKQITFEEAARLFSDDKETKQNGGLMVNPSTGATKWTLEDIAQIDQNLAMVFENNMNVGDITKAIPYTSPDAKMGYRLLTIFSRTDPHRANMKDDYAKLLQMATFEKQKEKMGEWITKRSRITYIKIDPKYFCKFEHNWVITN
jgi:peptidyl-prolyl cis-trans isomerase SurA